VVSVIVSRSGFKAHRCLRDPASCAHLTVVLSYFLVQFCLQLNSVRLLLFFCFQARLNLCSKTIDCVHKLFVFKNLLFSDRFDSSSHDSCFIWPERLLLVKEVGLKCYAGLGFKPLARIEVLHASDWVVLRFQNRGYFFGVVLAAPPLRRKRSQEYPIIVKLSLLGIFSS